MAEQEREQPTAGPIPGTRYTDSFVREIGRLAYFWAWPMVNIHNRRATFVHVPHPGLLGGIVPIAPLNQLAMLHDYITPEQRLVACPNQDVVYGFGCLALDREPAVVQVPDFGDRFWVYQVCDQRTDGFADLGAMYGTTPGFYLIVGPDWQGDVPDGIAGVFRSPTQTAICIPRAFLDDSDADRAAIQPLINQIAMYPLSDYDGTVKIIDWQQAPSLPAPSSGAGETQWVFPERFPETLPLILDEVPPLPGEEALYAQFRALAAAIAADPALNAALLDACQAAEAELVGPLLQFRNYGIPLAHQWTTLVNNAAFGTDYYSRTAAARSNIFVNKPLETKYLYQDLDASGERLNGAHRYRVHFPSGQVPPCKGFWSLTLYNEHHFFHPNPIERYSLGTKNRSLVTGADGSLTIQVQAEQPGDSPVENWLPAPTADFSLYLRAYWPEQAVIDGTWTPPIVERLA